MSIHASDSSLYRRYGAAIHDFRFGTDLWFLGVYSLDYAID